MNVLDLFSGIGGMSLGLERAGMRTVAFVECDLFCRAVLRKHWPDVPQFDDVRTFGRESLHGTVDLIAGGDPCQENSNARQAYKATAPSLGADFIRVVAEFRPRLVLRENPARVRADAPWPWHRFRTELERLGYLVLPFRLRACCCGADHERCRMFLLAHLPDADKTGLQGHERGELAEPDGRKRSDANPAGPDRWSATPRICGRPHGIPHRMDRLRALGNAVVPQVVELIGRWIMAWHAEGGHHG